MTKKEIKQEHRKLSHIKQRIDEEICLIERSFLTKMKDSLEYHHLLEALNKLKLERNKIALKLHDLNQEAGQKQILDLTLDV